MKSLVEVKNLSKYFGRIKAVDNVSLAIGEGEILGLVGESGSGKSTLGRLVLGLLPSSGGEVLRHVQNLRQEMQIIFQDPLASLNPRMQVEDILAEPLKIHKTGKREESLGFARDKVRGKVEELLNMVGLGKNFARRYPHELSGGEGQRIGIARALALKPRFVVADEPVSSLDLSVQAQILNLLLDLKKELGLTYLFISHDLDVVRYLSDRIAVMHEGKIVEVFENKNLEQKEFNPYTKALFAAVPRIAF